MFDLEAYEAEVQAMSAEERYAALLELYLGYGANKLRPPCTTEVDGKSYRIMLQVTTPSIRGPIQFPSYLGVHEAYLPKIEGAKASGQMTAVPLHLVFVPKEREMLIRIGILQNNVTAEQLQRAELEAASRSDDPTIQEYLAETMAVSGGWGSGVSS